MKKTASRKIVVSSLVLMGVLFPQVGRSTDYTWKNVPGAYRYDYEAESTALKWWFTNDTYWVESGHPQELSDSADLRAPIVGETPATDPQNGRFFRLLTLPQEEYSVGSVLGSFYNKLRHFCSNKPYDKTSETSVCDLSSFYGHVDLGYPFRLNLLGSTVLHNLHGDYKPVIAPAAETVTIVSNLMGRGIVELSGAGTVRLEDWSGARMGLRLSGEEGAEVELKGAPDVLPDDLPGTPYLVLDASQTNTMVFSDAGDGQLKVTKWADCRGADYADRYAAKNGSWLVPVVDETGPHGEHVLDFGELRTEKRAYESAAHLKITGRTDGRYCEAFVVFKSNTNCVPPGTLGIGSSTEFSLTPFNNTVTTIYRQSDDPLESPDGWSRYYSAGYASNYVYESSFRMDGERLFAHDKYNLAGWHILSLGVGEQGNVPWFDTIGGGRYSTGGAKIAEVVIYENALTSDQRRQVIRHLQRKWLSGLPEERDVDWDFGAVTLVSNATVRVGSGRTARIRALAGGNGQTVTKCGGGTLEVGMINTPPNDNYVWQNATKKNTAFPLPLTVTEGTVKVVRTNPTTPLTKDDLPEGIVLHLDPTDTSSFEFHDGHGDYIRVWHDTRETAPGLAWDGTTNPWEDVNETDHPPRLIRNAFGPGLHGVDCVSGTSKGDQTIYKRPHFYYDLTGAFATNKAQKLRACFMVFRQANGGCGSGYYTPIGSSDSYRFQYACEGNAFPGGQFLKQSASESSPDMASSYWALDGVEVDGPSYHMTSNTVVYAFNWNASHYGNVLARMKTNNTGGFMLGEIILYQRQLTPVEVRTVEAYLLNKWKGKTHPFDAARRTGNTSVAAGATLAVGANAALSVEGDLSVAAGGTLDVGGVTTAAAPVLAKSLAIGDGATVRVGLPTDAPAGFYPLVQADSLSVNPSALVVEGPAGLDPGRRLSLCVKNGALCCKCSEGGLVIIFR